MTNRQKMCDEKALRAAELLRQYCGERGCSECVFQSEHGFCLLHSVRMPERWQLDDVKRGEQDGRTSAV